MSAKKELKELVKAAEKQGWRVKKTKKGHLMFLAPDGVNKLTTGGTPGDHKGDRQSAGDPEALRFQVEGTVTSG